MGSFTDFWEDEVMDHLFGAGTKNYTSPTIYIGLSTTSINDDGTGKTEPAAGAYARVLTAAADWHNSSGGVVTNHNAITFPKATASWGVCAYFFGIDNAAGGNMLFYGTLTNSKTVDIDDTVSFAADALSVSLA